MKLTILGRYGPFPAPGGACSSYLVEGPKEPGKAGGKTVAILLDLGSGTFARFLSVCPLQKLDAIFLSHLHSDHMSDMLVVRYALQQLHGRGVPVPTPLHVISPYVPEAEYRMLASAGTFNIIKAEDQMKFRFGALTVTLHRMLHPVPTYAIDILEEEPARLPVYGKDMPQKRLVYTGDTGMHEGLLPLCANASLLLADVGMMPGEKSIKAAHLTAAEAGILARNAGVGRLVMTHLWGGGVDEEQMLEEAQAYFEDAELACEMATYDI